MPLDLETAPPQLRSALHATRRSRTAAISYFLRAPERAIRPGVGIATDVIIAVDGTRITTADDFLTAIESKRPGDEVVLSIVRDWRQMDVAITLSESEPH